MISRACTGKPASAATLTRKGFPTNWLTQLHGRRESELSGVVMPSVDDITAAFTANPGLAVYSEGPGHFERTAGPSTGPKIAAAYVEQRQSRW